MKVREKVFTGILTTSLLASFATIVLGYGIVRNRLKDSFEKHYEFTQRNLVEALVSLEADSDRIGMNAAHAFKFIEATSGLPKPAEYQALKKLYSVANFFATNSNGDFVFATNGFSLENGKLQGINLFKICPFYKNVLTKHAIEQTPIIYNGYENKLDDSYKYTMLSSFDGKKVLEVGISVQPIIDRLWSVFHSDDDIRRLTLFASTGKSLVSFPPNIGTSREFPENDYFNQLETTGRISRWTNDGLLLMTKINPVTNGGKCYECKEKGLSYDDNYHYILSSFVSSASLQRSLNFVFLAFFSIVILALVASFYLSRYFSRRITSPIENITNNFRLFTQDISRMVPLEIRGDDEVADLGRQFNFLLERTLFAQVEKIDSEKNRALAQQGRSVYHDAKNPLTAVKLMIDRLDLSDEIKSKMRHMLNRVEDVLNSLLNKHGDDKTLKSHLLINLVGLNVSESRELHKDLKGISISFDHSADAYFLFAILEAGKLQRVLSNIIKNSVDALNESGSIVVELKGTPENTVLIRIIDNGIGIPPNILSQIYEEGFSYGKKQGSGLGLYEVRQFVKRWNGTIVTESKVNEGTKTTIILPRSTAPSWFVGEIKLTPEACVVIVDDDEFLHSFIKETFQRLGIGNSIYSLYSAAEFSNWSCSINKDNKYLYLFDLNLGSTLDGLDLIESYRIQKDSYLVTHRWDEEETRDRCLVLNVGLIPKGLIDLLAFKVIERTRLTYDVVVIDDDISILRLLREIALRENISILTFNSVTNFLQECAYIGFDSVVCVDSDLGSITPGEDQAKKIHEEGFHRLYSTSVDGSKDLSALSWIIGRRKKSEPWKPYIEFGASEAGTPDSDSK